MDYTAIDLEGMLINIFFNFSMKICCRYSLEAPRGGASNEYNNICFHGDIRIKALVALVSRLSLSVGWKNGPERGLMTVSFNLNFL